MESLTVPGTLDALEGIRAYVNRVATTAGLDRQTTYRLVGAADEIATNIVMHGYAEAGRNGVVHVWAEITRQALTISIEDTGGAYDPDRQAPPVVDLPLDEREPGGLGLFLARQKVDELRYERLADRNRHTLVVYRQAC